MANSQKDDNAYLPLQDPGELSGSVLAEERGTSQEAAEGNRIPDIRHISLHKQLHAGHHMW